MASDLAKELIDAAAEAIAAAEESEGFDGTWTPAGRAAAVAVLEALDSAMHGDAVFGMRLLSELSDEIRDPQNTGGRRSPVVDYVDGAEFVRLYLPECEVTITDG